MPMTLPNPHAEQRSLTDLRARGAVNRILGELLGPLIPDFAERMAVGNRVCSDILAALIDHLEADGGAAKCASCNGLGYFIEAPGTATQGGKRHPCGACQPAVNLTVGEQPWATNTKAPTTEAAAMREECRGLLDSLRAPFDQTQSRRVAREWEAADMIDRLLRALPAKAPSHAS